MSQPTNARSLISRVASCLALLLATAALALLPSTAAQASCPINDPTCEPGPTTHPHIATLTVTAPSSGTITSTPGGISCPGDCTAADEQDTLSLVWPTTGWTTYVLTAAGGPTGTSPVWTGCDSVSSDHQCTVVNDSPTTNVSMVWHDTQAPTVVLSQPSSNKVGPTMMMAASASDNAGVNRVEFLVDGVLKATDSTAPYGASVSMSGYADGSQHTIAARAYDTSNNMSSTVTRTVTVDKVASLTVGTLPSYISSTDQATLSISTDPDATMQCRVDSGPSTPCAGPTHQFLDAGAPDGSHAFTITATDDVGNTSSIILATVLDTTRPTIAITRAPASGVIATAGSFMAHATDANLDTLTCTLDGRAITCANDVSTMATFAPGRHTFVATAHDKAGNAASASRAFTSRGKTALRATKRIHKRRATLRASHLPVAATGTVVFLRGKHKLCKATVHRGTANCRTRKLAKGKYKVSARYLGSAYYAPARATLTFRVR